MIKEYTRPLEQGIDSDKNIFSVLEERSPLRSSKTRSSPSPKDLSLVA